MKHHPALFVAALILLASALPCSAVVYVKHDSPGPTFDGASWETAFHKVMEGLNAAAPGGEVWVARGTYVEKVTLKAGVGLYGGFAGTETSREQRDTRASRTVLDGSPSGSGSVVVSPTGAATDTVIDGFTIRNGTASNGGGIYCSASSPTISNNVLLGNTGTSAGGGIYCYSNSNPVIANNRIIGNRSSFGAAIRCTSSSPTIVNNEILANGGNAIECSQSSNAIIANNVIGEHVTTIRGAAIRCFTSAAVISNNIVAFNSSGIYSDTAMPTLRNNCVYGNASYNYWGVLPGIGDISVDPKIASRTYGNYHITPASPCRDSGYDAAAVPGFPDADGQPRIQGAHVDIGADESDGTSYPAGPYVTVRVSPSGDDANDGSTWTLAKETVQAGIDAASAKGGEVWVAAGIYNERVLLHAYANLYGGFEGDETALPQRDWRANASVLDGGSSGAVVTIQGGEFVTLIDGFTIRKGSDGGVKCSSASTIIRNNTVTDNNTGISCSYSKSMISGNTIIGNGGSYGGGIYINYFAGTISNNHILRNTASNGGGIYCSESVDAIITGNRIAGNSGHLQGGGGIYGTAVITGNTIIGNTGTQGGGILASGKIANNIIAFNSSGVYTTSGVTYNSGNNCIFGNWEYDYAGFTPAPGDISVDPQITGWEYGDIHIRPGSPCVNAGSNTAQGISAADIDGQMRVQDGTIDIGADESNGAEPPNAPFVVVRVSPEGDDANDGSTWALAKRTVQAAIDAASARGGEVWVKAGIYVERLNLLPFAHLYGGFAGTETLRSERDRKANVTVLDGLTGAVSSEAVVTARAGHRMNTVDGFTIRGGWKGGVYCQYSGPTISNNFITGNSAFTGGGITADDCSPFIVGNTITANVASGRGGGIYCSDSSSIIANNIIAGNTGGDGGAICCHYKGPTLVNNTMVGNASNDYGAIYAYSAGVKMSNNILAFNTGGIRGEQSGFALRNNCIYGNVGFNYWSSLQPGTGDISVDPGLAGMGYGEFRLRLSSPCVNAGWNDAPGLQPSDIDGLPRILGGTADIGAYESDGAEPPGGPRVIVRVSPDGDDANDGSTWSLAKKTVQAAIDAAAERGGEVWARAGIYNERVTLRPFAWLYGGFAGTECLGVDRDRAANVTTLDGGAGGAVATVKIGHRMTGIDGFTVRNGSDSGIQCYRASAVIANNLITGNTSNALNVYNGGGGIFSSSASPLIANNVIAGNTAFRRGGAINCHYGWPTIVNNTIMGNTAASGGGAVYTDSSTPAVANNVVAFNSSGIYRSGGTPTLRNNCVHGNTDFNYSGIAAGTGDIALDPLVANRAAGDYHLTGPSPCIDAGWSGASYLPQYDLDRQARAYGASVDIGVDEFWPTDIRLYEAKAVLDGAKVGLHGFPVTAAFEECFYIEADDRSSGIRVDMAAHGIQAGDRVSVLGMLKTNADGERFIDASSVTKTGAGSVEPVFINSRALGGIGWLYDAATGAGQCGVVGGMGLNNIGMLVNTWGKVAYVDGEHLLDLGTGRSAKILGEGMGVAAKDSYIRVTGISSCFRDAAGLHPTIRVIDVEPVR